MTANFHNISLLYRYLRMLSVQVDFGTVARLLTHPMGSSMRGLSDALDVLGIRNAVYQLPPEYFDQLEAPFITVTRQAENPFCLIERKEGTSLTTYKRGKQVQMEKEAFLSTWTGGVLIGEVTAETWQDKLFRIRNVINWLRRYSLLIAGVLGTILVVGLSSSVEDAFYRCTLCAGIFISAAILYKENINRNFLHRFCSIGTAINCNTVLQSAGARLAGIGLGELSLFYFSTMLLFALVFPYGFWPLAAACTLTALAFTVYSIVYQLFVIKKGCMLCLMVSLTVWLNSLALYELWNPDIGLFPSFTACAALGLSAFASLAVWHTVKHNIQVGQEAAMSWERLSTILNAEAFKALSAIQPHIGEMPDRNICLHNGKTEGDEVLIVTNPTCKNCAHVHPYIKELSAHTPVSLVLLAFPGDNTGREVALRLTAAWRQDGWDRMLELLEMWNEKHDLSKLPHYHITERTEQIYQEHLRYAVGQHITQTPSVIVQGAYLPEAYRIEDLKYVLT